MATKRASRPRVLVATDGSRDAQAAIATTMHFPWPAQTRVRVISARRTGAEYRRSILLTALDRGAEKAAESAQRTLSRRWPDIEIEVVDKSPVEGILDEPERLRADVIVVGWRGHGAVRRLLMLRSYQWPRLVILKPNTSVLEAARALDNNQVGAIVVQHEGGVAGIVTDRDLAVRVLGQGLDARDTRLATVMTVDVVTLPPDASRTEAMRLMRERRIRRIPLVAEGEVVGVVTLDDLLADEAASLEHLADVVRAQVGDGGPKAPTRLEMQATRRRASRLDASYRRFVNEFRTESSLPSADQADTALMIVLSALVRRLTADEAKDLIAQLPLRIGERLRELPDGPDKSITVDAIQAELVERLGVDSGRAVEVLGAAVRTLDANVSAGQMQDVRHQLPKDLRSVFTPSER